MPKRKVLVIDENIEQALSTVCDAALNFAEIQIAKMISEICESIKEETTLSLDDEEWLE